MWMEEKEEWYVERKEDKGDEMSKKKNAEQYICLIEAPGHCRLSCLLIKIHS